MSIDEYMRQLHKKRRRLRCPWYDIRVCCSPWWHRPYWRYVPDEKRFECEICRRIAV